MYDLVADPAENRNLAPEQPALCAWMEEQLQAWIRRREAETGLPNPILHQAGWHGTPGIGYFSSSQEAYDTLHIGDPKTAARLQARDARQDPE